jgi:hypothetical protein
MNVGVRIGQMPSDLFIFLKKEIGKNLETISFLV